MNWNFALTDLTRVQLVDAVAASAYSFSVTFAILSLMDFTTWFKADLEEPIVVVDG